MGAGADEAGGMGAGAGVSVGAAGAIAESPQASSRTTGRATRRGLKDRGMAAAGLGTRRAREGKGAM